VFDVVTMRFNVAQLLRSPVGSERRYELADDITGIDDSITVLGPLTGKIRLLRTSDGILVTGRLHTVVSIPCRRCLEAFAQAAEVSLEEQFCPSIDIYTGVGIPPEDTEEAANRIDGHHLLDLTEVVRQNLLLALPMSPLCKPDCLGLCPVCGANLNIESCGCHPEMSDPRLESLHQLL